MKRLLIICLAGFAAVVSAGCGDSGDEGDNGRADVVTIPDEGVADVLVDDEGSLERDVEASDSLVDTVDPVDASDSGSLDVPVVSNAPNYLVIASDSLLDSANELAEYRESLGYRTQVMTRSDVLGSEIASTANWENMARGKIKQAKKALGNAETLFVVLVGDAEKVDEDGFTKPIPVVECENVLTDICYTDNRIADLNADNVPDVAIGRITASTNAGVLAYLDKVKAHEASYTPGLWNRKVSLYIGEAGFSPQIDSLLETFTFIGLDRVSHAFDIVGAYDSENSDYYYTPFHDKVVELINGGSLMTVYIGHGNSGWTQGLTSEQLDEINCGHRLPVMVFLACLNGDFANGSDTISEGMLRLENGPVAVFAAADDSHPVGNAVLAYEVTRVGLEQRPATVGELFMGVKNELLKHTDDFRAMIDEASIAYGEEGCDDPATLYWQHADLYNLLGDPAVAMNYPAGEIQDIEVVGTLAAKAITVSGKVPGVASGTAYATIEVTRNEYVGTMAARPDEGDPSWESTIQSNWAVANTKVFAATTVDVVEGSFTADLTWTNNVGGGDRYIKVYAWDGQESGQGTIDAIAEYRINK